jgi:hypothetical protein
MNDLLFKRQLAAYYHTKFPSRSSKDIGEELGYTSVWVRNWWNKNSSNSEAFQDGRKGRDMTSRSKVTSSLKQIIKRNMHGSRKVKGGFRRKLSQRKMKKKLKENYQIDVSRQVIRNALKQSNLHYISRKDKVRLTENHMARRLKFAKVF